MLGERGRRCVLNVINCISRNIYYIIRWYKNLSFICSNNF